MDGEINFVDDGQEPDLGFRKTLVIACEVKLESIFTCHEPWILGSPALDLRNGRQGIIASRQHKHEPIREETHVAEVFDQLPMTIGVA